MRTSKNKRFYPGFQHLYSRSDDWGVIFYDDYDRLVFYTLQSAAKRSAGVVVLAASYMFTHVHSGIIARREKDVSDFVWRSTSPFSRAYNSKSRHKGAVFHRRFGWASKRTDKQVRSTLCYIMNNHVEKKLVSRASQCRWDFLAYATSDHPFSKEITNPSPKLRRDMKLIRKRYARNQPLSYMHMHNMFSGLGSIEIEQLKDFIISTYRLVDYDQAVKYFRGYDEMLSAPDIVTGNEYDVAEDFSSVPDIPYVEMASILEKDKSIDSVFNLNPDEQVALASDFSRMTGATADQIAKFLHLPIIKG